MDRWMIMLLLAAGGLAAVAPGTADAQVAVQVQLYWTWGDDGWRPHRPAYAPHRPVPAPRPGVVAHPAPHRSIRVPPGHLPPPGSCRLWYPGRPPGHQPPPQPCGSLLRTHSGVGGAVIVGAPDHRGVYDPGPGWEGRGRGGDDRGRRGKKGKRGKRGGRGF